MPRTEIAITDAVLKGARIESTPNGRSTMTSETSTGLVAKIERVWVEIVIDEDPDTSYLEQDEFADRLEQFRGGAFNFVGVRACAELRFDTPQGGWMRGPLVTSGGLWGIESDSGEDYFRSVGEEQADELKDQLLALGLSEARADYARRMAPTTLEYR